MYRKVRGKLELFDDPSHVQYIMLTKPYIYRTKVNRDGTFVAIVKGEESIETLKKEFKVKEVEIEEVLESVRI